MKYFYLSCFLLLLLTKTNAQDFPYGFVTHEDVALKYCPIDNNANAMVMKEFGTARMFHDEADGRIAIEFIYHVQIKIFNKNGFDNGNIAILQRIYDGSPENISDIKAFTINFTNGKFIRSELDLKKVFKETRNKYTAVTKFTLPNLMEGSIIEYSYRMISPSLFNFRGWSFQSSIPKLRSEYIALIPPLYNYNVSLRGPYKLTKQGSDLSKDCLRLQGVNIDCSKMTYIMENIPAFVEEEYMTAPSNFKSAINFELSDYQMMNGSKVSVTKSWKDIDAELTSDKSFGAQMKKKDAFKELLPEILKNTTDDLDKAKAVYAYIAKNIKSNGFIGIYSETAVKKAMESHSGNTGDINLALISALSAAGLDAEALILSTRDNGEVNNLYPVISDFNYVIAKLNIGDQVYLLDASEPLLPFNLLPLKCINGKGRVINLKKPSYWYDLKASQKDLTRYNLVATLSKDGKIKGELVTYSSGYAGLSKRRAIEAANSIDEYVEKLNERMSKISIKKHEIQNVDSLEQPLVEKYEIEMNAYDGTAGEQFFFNPFFIDRITKNSFNLNERTYPVDMGSTREVRTTIIIDLPEDLIVTDQPKNLNISLPQRAGSYLTSTTFSDHKIAFSQLLQLNKPIYGSEEYLYLKEFYSRIIQAQKTDIILKKSK